MLAPSVGNVHGDYPPSGPQLDLPRLRDVDRQIRGKAHLVLHGTNDFSPELVKECVAAGVTKLNVNKLLLEVWSAWMKEHAGEGITRQINGGMEVLKKEVVRWMEICGSAGKA